MPSAFEERYLSQIDEVINFLEKRINLYVIGNGLSFHLSQSFSGWLHKNRFKVFHLEQLNKHQISKLLKLISNDKNITITEGAEKSILDISDGVPGNIKFCLNRIISQNISLIDKNLAEQVFKENILSTWLETKRYLEAKNKCTKYVFNALQIAYIYKLSFNKNFLLSLFLEQSVTPLILANEDTSTNSIYTSLRDPC